MIFKLTLSVSGDNLNPENLKDNIRGNFIVTSSNAPGDKKYEHKVDTYDYGSISFWHPKKFAADEHIAEYEQSYIEFLENNYKLFADNGAEDFTMFIEVYHDGEQCNFEIFNKSTLAILTRYQVSIPVSVYSLAEKEFLQWMEEIELGWKN